MIHDVSRLHVFLLTDPNISLELNYSLEFCLFCVTSL